MELIKSIEDIPILITGAARSRTSLVAGIINICGAFGGFMSGATRNNKKGMFENAKIRNTILKPYLEELGVDRLGQYPLPNIHKLPVLPNLKKRILEILKNEEYIGPCKKPWMYKGAKMCLIWPVFNYAFPNARWIIVKRKIEDIAKSCVKTSFMRAFRKVENLKAINAKNEYEGWIWWVNQHLERYLEMEEAGLNLKYVCSDKIIKKDFSEIKETIDWLDLNWNETKINDFIDPSITNYK